MNKNSNLPLILACGGSCHYAKLAKDIAIVMADEGYATTMNLALLKFNSQQLRDFIQSGGKIMAIDACDSCCVKGELARLGIFATWHVKLSDYVDDNLCACQFDYVLMNKVLREIQSLLK